MKSVLTTREIDELLGEAEESFPDSNFVPSVSDWFDKHGFITDKQESALERIIERGDKMRNGVE